jgi:hypothetical protein
VFKHKFAWMPGVCVYKLVCFCTFAAGLPFGQLQAQSPVALWIT